jgi:hypothetical protein
MALGVQRSSRCSTVRQTRFFPMVMMLSPYGLRVHGMALPGAQTERRVGAGPVRDLLGGKDPTGYFFQLLTTARSGG